MFRYFFHACRRLRSVLVKVLIAVIWTLAALMVADAARAERVKDVASIAGVRFNQLAGYGIVVGLDGSGDQTTQTPFTVQSIISMLSGMGVSLPPGTNLQLKNVAAVMVTASLPPFARTGQSLDVTVSSMGNAKSLRGGTLVMTPLKGADGNVYAMAQGHVVVVGAGAEGAGTTKTINHLAVGRIANGATVEREVPTPIGQGEFVFFDINASDFSTAQRVAEAINKLKPGAASAIDGRQLKVRVPVDLHRRVDFLSQIENLDVQLAPIAAKVIVNSRTGSVVMTQPVVLEPCAVAHGNLSVSVSAANAASQPGALSEGKTKTVTNAQVDIQQEPGILKKIAGAKLSEVINTLNAMGANPQDLIAILQAMKTAGALRAELEII